MESALQFGPNDDQAQNFVLILIGNPKIQSIAYTTIDEDVTIFKKVVHEFKTSFYLNGH